MTTKRTEPGVDGPFGLASRRGFLKGLSLTVAAAGARSTLAKVTTAQTPAAPASTQGGAGSQIFHVVETTSGKVQGIATAGIKEFKGIPYGAPTGGKNRFMPPKKLVPWTGVRECFAHGQCCPQTISNLRSEYGMMIHSEASIRPVSNRTVVNSRIQTQLHGGNGMLSLKQLRVLMRCLLIISLGTL